ncbi:hypothetical protein [Candidatus Nitrosotalea okcheonensis]|uniref:Uncharacterized protein n=1 Tax=Candidatus Nitrosotalea okcheonensis TaxID=1903276 RepID=A0A2H1FFV2_9ARCH|nr:hypothetical protein [Candidatus Nitrosotalea okcheonensis]SMH71562.1 conserved protein of unknown function [Candidatus Nitrosotalea okcheonensis]
MVKEIDNNNTRLFLCEICKLGYDDVKFAQMCEHHCNASNSCSLEITKHAVLK